jgi:hypothetical protein
MPRRKREPDFEPETFEVSVWNHEGDVVQKLWEATEDDLAQLEAQYADDPFHTVVIDHR